MEEYPSISGTFNSRTALFFSPKRTAPAQTMFNTGKGSEQVIAVVVSGLIADRFTSFSLKLVSRLVLNLTAENRMTVPLAELCIALLGQKTPSSLPRESPVSLSPASSIPQSLCSSLLEHKSAAILQGASHITPSSQPTSQYWGTIPLDTTRHKATFRGKAT